MTIREQLEQRERELLGPWATCASDSMGRLVPEAEDPYRTAFQRDRDRILHTKAFRRLKRKTQVFLAPTGDHYRTRLSHTLEVSQIARTAARALFLNEDLVEAIALGHDLGHTPFGHAGETVLNELYAPGFRHYEQSLRVVDLLEKRPHASGINLTRETRDGILRHSQAKVLLYGEPVTTEMTPESMVVSVADAIAYISHDIEDALRANVIAPGDLPPEAVAILGETTSERIDRMVVGLIEGSVEGRIGILPDARNAMRLLRDYLYGHVYPCPAIENEIFKARRMIRELYLYLLECPTEEMLEASREHERDRCAVDFIAGMTDEYAMQLYRKLLMPRPWMD